MSLHPLQLAFIKHIKVAYSVAVNPKWLYHPDEKAERIRRLGVNYNTYVELACVMLHDWSAGIGWAYPYWNAVTSVSTVDRISRLLEIDGDVLVDSDYAFEFQRELAYAQHYIDWYIGVVDTRPRRNGEIDTGLRVDVAQYICDVYGVEYLSVNYNAIAASIENTMPCEGL